MSLVPLVTPTSTPGDATELPQTDQDILRFEARRWATPGAKVSAMSDEFALSEARYYQQLNRVLDDPRALPFDPILVGRLRRLRESRGRR